MIRRCAWCDKYLGQKEPMDSMKVSHGICLVCLEKQNEKLDKIGADEKEKDKKIEGGG